MPHLRPAAALQQHAHPLSTVVRTSPQNRFTLRSRSLLIRFLLSTKQLHSRHRPSHSIRSIRRYASASEVEARFARLRSAPASASSLSDSTSPLPSPPPRRPRTLRPYLYALVFLTLGLVTGNLTRHAIAPPAPAIPGSDEDRILLAQLEKDIDGVEIVRELRRLVKRGEAPPGDTPSTTSGSGRVYVGVHGSLPEEGWRELPAQHYALPPPPSSVHSDTPTALPPQTPGPPAHSTPSIAEADTLKHITLSGHRGLGTSRTIHNPSANLLISVIWFGPALSGWPGIAHGGAIATVLEDEMTTLASQLQSNPNGGRSGTQPKLKHLDLTYQKPTTSGDFYIVKATTREGRDWLKTPDEEKRKPSSSSSSPSGSGTIAGTDTGLPLPPALPSPTTEDSQEKPSISPSGGRVQHKLDPIKQQSSRVTSVSAPQAEKRDLNTVEVHCTLSNLKGRTCVRAHGVFDVSSGVGGQGVSGVSGGVGGAKGEDGGMGSWERLRRAVVG